MGLAQKRDLCEKRVILLMDLPVLAKMVNANLRQESVCGGGFEIVMEGTCWGMACRGGADNQLIICMHLLFDIIAPSFNCVFLLNLGATSQITFVLPSLVNVTLVPSFM